MEKLYRVHQCATRLGSAEIAIAGRKVTATFPTVIAEVIPLEADGVDGSFKLAVDPEHVGIFADGNVISITFAANEEATAKYHESDEFKKAQEAHQEHLAKVQAAHEEQEALALAKSDKA